MAHRDHGADGWERSDFPITCESCFGDNPYVRMTRADYDKECKICRRPFTAFRWRPGRNARFKKPEICQTCCKLKNVCQVCLLDLEFDLPVQVRDTALNINSTHYSILKSHDDHDRKTGAGLDYESSFGKMLRNDTISNLQRTTPYYERNEMPKTGELSQQNIKDRYYGVNDPVAMKLLGKAGEMGTLEPPEDESIKTLYVGGLNSSILEQDIHDKLYAYGEIESIRVLAEKGYAFVTYTTREGAEKAIQALSNRLVVCGQRLKLTWGRPKVPKPDQSGSNQQQQCSVARSGLIPRAAISQQQYYTHPPPPNQYRPYYPSMDPQRMGAVISTQEGGGSSTSENDEASSSYPMPPHQPYPPLELSNGRAANGLTQSKCTRAGYGPDQKTNGLIGHITSFVRGQYGLHHMDNVLSMGMN